MQSAILSVKIKVDGQDVKIPINNLKELKDAVKQINEQRILLRPDSAGFKEATTQVNTLNRLYLDLKRGTKDVGESIKRANDLITSGSTETLGYYRQLQARLVDLTNKYKDLSLAQVKGKVGEALRKQVEDTNNQLKKLDAGLGNYQRNVGNYRSAFTGLAGAFGLVSGAIAAFAGSKIVQTTAEFEKLITVMTQNLGGDRLGALEGFETIRQFAADTPFQVNELTESFVRLQSRGINPSIDTLTKLGDFASSQGRSIQQVTEAVLDAQVGQTRRMEELGVVAAVNGDKVKFAFKNITGEIPQTVEGVKTLINELSKATGVAGSMAAQSKTLGGAISNAGDAFDRLFFAIGNSSGVLKATVQGFSKLVNEVAELIETPLSEEIGKQQLEFNALVGALQQTNIDTDIKVRLQNELISKYPDYLKFVNDDRDGQIDLAKTLLIGNALFERRILLQVREEQAEKFARRKVKLLEDEVSQRKRLADLIERSDDVVFFGTKAITSPDAIIAQAQINNSEGYLDIIKGQREELDNRIKEFNETTKQLEGLLLSTPEGQDAKKLLEQLDAAKAAKAAAETKRNAERQKELFGKQTADEKARLKEREKFLKEQERLNRIAAFVPSGASDQEAPSTESPFFEGIAANLTDTFDLGLENLGNEFKDDIDAQIRFLEEYTAEIRKSFADGIIPEYIQGKIDVKAAELKALKEVRDAEKAFDEERKRSDEEEYQRQQGKAEREIELQREKNERIKELAFEAAAQTASSLLALERQSIENELDEKLDALETEYAAKIDAAQGNAVIEEQLRKELDAKKAELEKEAARRRKAIAVKEALIEGALAAIKAGWNPYQLALVALTTAFNVALINAQQFAHGGVVQRQKSGYVTQRPNAPTTANGDNVITYLKQGELVMNQEQQLKAMRLAGGDFFKKIGIPNARVSNIRPAGVQPIRVSVGNDLELSEGQMGSFALAVGDMTAKAVGSAVSNEMRKANKAAEMQAKLAQFKLRKNR